MPGYIIKKTGEYFYVLPHKTVSTSPMGSALDIPTIDNIERSKTPPTTHSSFLATHRRVASCGNPVAYSRGSSLEGSQRHSVDKLLDHQEEDCRTGEEGGELPHFWLIFHFVPAETGALDMGLFFHVRWVCFLVKAHVHFYGIHSTHAGAPNSSTMVCGISAMFCATQ